MVKKGLCARRDLVQKYHFACLETLATMPEADKARMRAVPPWETKSKGMPENGIRPISDAMFMNDSTMTRIAIPETRKPPKSSGERAAMRKHLIVNRTNRMTRAVAPTKPNFSAVTA